MGVLPGKYVTHFASSLLAVQFCFGEGLDSAQKISYTKYKFLSTTVNSRAAGKPSGILNGHD
jgi:hypothetical protein